MKATTFLKMAALVLPLMLASCHSKKQAVVEEPKPITQQQIEQNEFRRLKNLYLTSLATETTTKKK